MLNWNNVLKYVRHRLALPTSFIEKNDEELREYFIDNTLAEFSNYFPDWERTGIITGNANYQHPTKRNWYLILDEENLDIFGIKECYFPFEGHAFTGHPIMPPMSFEGMKFWSLEVFKSRFFQPFSLFSYTYKFITPNVIEIPNEVKPDTFVVEYERMHPPDLSKIPLSMQQRFKELCCADAMLWLGGIRSMYQNMQTPFGEIPLNADALLSRGEDLKQKVLDEIKEDSRPPIVIETY